jgi:Peptidase A4 family
MTGPRLASLLRARVAGAGLAVGFGASLRCAAASLVCAAASLVSAAAPVGAAANSVVFAPSSSSMSMSMSSVSMSAVSMSSAAGSGANSSNWAGWAVAGHHTSVTASWREPAVTCAAHETSDSAFWIGLDGYGSHSVEQTGTQAGCSDGHAFYAAWTEFYPAPSSNLSSTVRPGDSLHGTVTYVSGHTYRLTLSDSTQGWSRSVTGTASSATNASAEIVAEAPTDGRTGKTMALTKFGSATFTSTAIDGHHLSQVTGIRQLVMGSSKRIMAATTSISSAQSFGVTWRAASG